MIQTLRLSKQLVQLLFLVSLLGATLLPGSARASEAQAEAALQIAEAGVKLYKLNQYREALDFFLKSYELHPLPDVVWNIGRCYEELREPKKALRFFEESAAKDPSETNREKAKRKVEDLMTLYFASVAFETVPEGATVEVDGVPMGETPIDGRVLGTGRHQLRVSLPGYKTVEQEIRISSGEANRFKIRLKRPLATLTIDAGKEVFGARVTIDDEYKGTFPLPTTLKLKDGKHSVEVIGVMGFESLKQEIILKAGEAHKITLQPM